jgi:transcription antitermination factor NusG
MSIQERLPVLMTPGVVGVVGAGKTPIAIPMEEIESLQVMVNSNLFLKPWPFLQLGQRVRIRRGPLTDLEGDLVKVKNELRCVVSVRLLQRSVAAEVDADWLEPLVPIMRCGLHESPGNRLAATPPY